VLCQLSYSHRHCDYSNCDSELSEFTLALRKDREGLPVAGRAVGARKFQSLAESEREGWGKAETVTRNNPIWIKFNI
jgi:hypothetical protein